MFRPSLLLPSDDYRSSSMRRVVCVCSGIVIESGIFLLMALLSWLFSVMHVPSRCWVMLLSPLLLFDCTVGFLGMRQLYVSRCWLLQSERRRRRLLLFSICMRALSTFSLSLVLVNRLSVYLLPMFPFFSYIGGVYLNKQAEDRYSWLRLHAWDLPVLLTAINFCCSARATAAASAGDHLHLLQSTQQPQGFPADNIALAAAAATHLQRLKGTPGTGEAALPSSGTATDTATSPHTSSQISVKVAVMPAAAGAAHAVIAAATAEKEGAWSGAALLWPEFLLCLVMLAICAILWYLLNADTSLRQDSLLRLSLSFLLHLSASFFLAVIFLAQYIDQRYARDAANAAAAADTAHLPVLLAPVVTATNTAAAASRTSMVKERTAGETKSSSTNSSRSGTSVAATLGESRGNGGEGGKERAAAPVDVTPIDSILPGYVLAAETLSLIPASYWAVPLVFALLLLQFLTAALMVYCIAKHTHLQTPPSFTSQQPAETAALLHPATVASSLEEGYGITGYSSSSSFGPAAVTLQQQRPPLVRDMTVSLERVGHHFYRLLVSPEGGGEEKLLPEQVTEQREAEADAEDATGGNTYHEPSRDLENALVHTEQHYPPYQHSQQQQQQHLQQQQPRQQHLQQQHLRQQDPQQQYLQLEHAQQEHLQEQHSQQQHAQQQDPQQQRLQQRRNVIEEPQREQDFEEKEQLQQSVRKQQLQQHQAGSVLRQQQQAEHEDELLYKEQLEEELLQEGLLQEEQFQEELLQEEQSQEELLQEELQQQLLVGAEGHEEDVKRGSQHRRWRKEAGADLHVPQQLTCGQQATAAGYGVCREDTIAAAKHLKDKQEREAHSSIENSLCSSATRYKDSAPGEAGAGAPAVAMQSTTIGRRAVYLQPAEAAAAAAVVSRLEEESAAAWTAHDFGEEDVKGEAGIAAEETHRKQEKERRRENSRSSSEGRGPGKRQESPSWICRRAGTESREELPAEAESGILCRSSHHRKKRPQSCSGTVDSRESDVEEEDERKEGNGEESKEHVDGKDREGKREKARMRETRKMREKGGEERRPQSNEEEEQEERETEIRKSKDETRKREHSSALPKTPSSPSASNVSSASSGTGALSWWRPWRYLMPQRAAPTKEQEAEEGREEGKVGASEVSREATEQKTIAARETQAEAEQTERKDSRNGTEDRERRGFGEERIRTPVLAVTAVDVLTQGGQMEAAEKVEIETFRKATASSAGRGEVYAQAKKQTAMTATEKDDTEKSEKSAWEDDTLNERRQRHRRSPVPHTQINSSSGITRGGNGDVTRRDSHILVNKQQTRERKGGRMERSCPVETETRQGVTLIVGEEDVGRKGQQSQARQAVEAALSSPEAGAGEEAGEAERLAVLVTAAVAGRRVPSRIHSISQTEEINPSREMQSGTSPVTIGTTTTRTATTAGMHVRPAVAAATAATGPRAPPAGSERIRTEEALTPSPTTETSEACTNTAGVTETGEREVAAPDYAPAPPPPPPAAAVAAAAATESRQGSGMRSDNASGHVADAATRRGDVYRSTTPEEPDLCIICFQRVRDEFFLSGARVVVHFLLLFYCWCKAILLCVPASCLQLL